MTILVLGASGATGRLVVNQLLERNEQVKIIVREGSHLPSRVLEHDNVEVIQATLLELSDDKLLKIVSGCEAVISCLGHNLTFKGIYGHPRRLVTEATQRVCNAIEKLKPSQPVKYILMNTSGNRNEIAGEKVSCAHTIVVSLIRALIPPHSDNEKAADFLQKHIEFEAKSIEWIAIRPDSLIDQQEPSEYQLYPSPVRDPIFNAGKTSRINVAHFMARLVTEKDLWKKWQSHMPVIYDNV